jgi:hypothetical protein
MNRKRMQQHNRQTVAHNPVNDLGVVTLDALGRKAFHPAIRTQVSLATLVATLRPRRRSEV